MNSPFMRFGVLGRNHNLDLMCIYRCKVNNNYACNMFYHIFLDVNFNFEKFLSTHAITIDIVKRN